MEIYQILSISGRLHFDSVEQKNFDALLSNISDWNKFFDILFSNGLAPLVYKKISSNYNEVSLPSDVLNKFKKAYVNAFLNNSKRYFEFQAIAEELNKRNIIAIPMKGIYLCKSLYDDIALRVMGDLDILVKEEELEIAKDIFLQEGWIFKDKNEMFKSKYHQQINDSITHQPYTFIKNGVLVELHKHIHVKTKSFQVNIVDFIKNSKSEKILDKESAVFSNEDSLIHLCLHTYNDTLGSGLSFKHIVDIAEFLKQRENNIDWNKLKATSSSYGCYDIVNSVLVFCNEYLQSPVDSSFLKRNWRAKLFETIYLSYLSKGNIYKFVHVGVTYSNKIIKLRYLKNVLYVFGLLYNNIFPIKEYVKYQSERNKYRFHYKLYQTVGLL
jgi:hypothetical protein